MNEIAERYVKLVLATGQHDPAYVDSYYGPPEEGRGREREDRWPTSMLTPSGSSTTWTPAQ